jgi:hypothetical protein
MTRRTAWETNLPPIAISLPRIHRALGLHFFPRYVQIPAGRDARDK